MFTSTDLLFLGVIIVLLLALGVLITLGNERARRATLELRDVAREYALADLRIRREAMSRAIQYDDQDKAVAAISQILLDVVGQKRELAEINLAPGGVVAITCLELSGREAILTPAREAYLEAYPDKREAVTGEHLVNGLNSGEFVVEELAAVAHFLGAQAMPRTEEWTLLEVGGSGSAVVHARRRGISGLLGRLLPART